MRAVLLQAHGAPEEALVYRVGVPEPLPAADEVVLRVRATTVNRVDILLRRGYPGLALPLPHILGGDIVGEVVDANGHASELPEGTRVVVYPLVWCGRCHLCRRGFENLCQNWQYIGMHRAGGYAEYVAVPARCCIPLPDTLSDSVAACLGVAGLTAYHALEVARVGPGDVVVVWGATGGMGTFLLQLARHRGATVIATTRRHPEHHELLRSWGADTVVPSSPPEAAVRAILERFPEGVDVVIDYVGAATLPSSLSLLRKGGCAVLCGMLTGREVLVNIHSLYLRHICLQGIYLGSRAEFTSLLDLVASGVVRPFIYGVYPLSEAAALHRQMEDTGLQGKAVLLP